MSVLRQTLPSLNFTPVRSVQLLIMEAWRMATFGSYVGIPAPDAGETDVWGVFQRQGSRLVRTGDGAPPHPRIQLRHDRLRASVMSAAYPCVMGAAALRADHYAFAAFAQFGTARAAEQLAAGLEWFVRTHPEPVTEDDPFTTFVSTFDGPVDLDDVGFERTLWRQLQLLHEVDRRRWPWDPRVSGDPADPRFSFSVAGHAFFVIGMHPRAARLARTAFVPALVFNRHQQFDLLRERGQMQRVSDIIRARDRRLQGWEYPTLAQFGQVSEARQYAGRVVDQDWRCPFVPGASIEETEP
jgi:FPC/CPF motif-containing protein YcgG